MSVATANPIASGPGTSYVLNDNKTSLGLPKRHVIGATARSLPGLASPGLQRTADRGGPLSRTRSRRRQSAGAAQGLIRVIRGPIREPGEGVEAQWTTTDLDTLTATLQVKVEADRGASVGEDGVTPKNLDVSELGSDEIET
jgi:hypothetical protein